MEEQMKKEDLKLEKRGRKKQRHHPSKKQRNSSNNPDYGKRNYTKIRTLYPIRWGIGKASYVTHVTHRLQSKLEMKSQIEEYQDMISDVKDKKKSMVWM